MHTIEITTSQNVTIEYELAGLRERFFALLVDTIIIAFIWLALVIFVGSLGFGNSSFLMQAVGVFPFWFLILYYMACEALLNGQTLGKRTQRTKVVRIDGKPISLSDLLLRAVLQLGDYVFSGGVLGALLISTTDKHQRLGDMAAGTTVIKIGTDRRFRLSDILSINTLDNYTPQYLEVKALSEEDMLLVKSVILRYQQYRNSSHEEAINNLYDHLKKILDLKMDLRFTPQKIEFFKTLIKDYIVLTR
jgi:uncharacterized RDD family membrane protein YckC